MRSHHRRPRCVFVCLPARALVCVLRGRWAERGVRRGVCARVRCSREIDMACMRAHIDLTAQVRGQNTRGAARRTRHSPHASAPGWPCCGACGRGRRPAGLRTTRLTWWQGGAKDRSACVLLLLALLPCSTTLAPTACPRLAGPGASPSLASSAARSRLPCAPSRSLAVGQYVTQ